ncbi:transcriptional regulator, AraC family [Methylocella silvestris BL2]|uniref:Transcriptional regulator, AraC family n=2 Tax=Methylocella silvestris TaxID=199596 RepID=B8ELR9_METSB|nr:transcriptional regulator, AraC family [Methylocella silvestris BL2]
MGGEEFLRTSSQEAHLSWGAGSVLRRTQDVDARCERNMKRDDVAIAICFQDAGSEVNWRLDGKQTLAKTYASAIESRDMFIAPPGCEIAVRCRGKGEGLWLFLEPEFVNSDRRIKSLVEKAAVFDHSWTKDRMCWMVASELRKECQNGFPRGPMFFESAATVFVAQLAYFLHDADLTPEPTRSLSDAKLRLVTGYIEANLHRNITLSELSALVDLTPRYFCGAFKEATGRPPHQYQIEQRVEQAKKLLAEAGSSLIEIALTVGFSSQSHLNEYFRRIVGMTPARYRNEELQVRSGASARSRRPNSTAS